MILGHECSAEVVEVGECALPQSVNIRCTNCDRKWLADKFNSDNGIDLRKDPMALQRLKEAAENAKKELSSAQQAQITCHSSPQTHLVLSTFLAFSAASLRR